MARRRNSVPKIRRHKSGKSDRAVCEYRDPLTDEMRVVTLGPWGSAEVEPAYRKLLGEIEAARAGAPKGEPIRVDQVSRLFLAHAESYYRDSAGRPTSEVRTHNAAVAVLLQVAGTERADEFGTARLLAVRDAMIARGWTRPHVNSQIRRIRGIWRWAAERELVDSAVWHRLCSLRGLGKGRTPAPEQEEIRPADVAIVDATCERLPPVICAMVRFQLLTGCRPQDACNLRADEIDRSGAVWVYRPGQHKGAWRGKAREVWIGPQAQELLAPWLIRAGGGYLFSPARRVEEQNATRSEERKTKMWASHAKRNEARKKGGEEAARREVHDRQLRSSDSPRVRRGAGGEMDSEPTAPHRRDRATPAVRRGDGPCAPRTWVAEHDGDLRGARPGGGGEGDVGGGLAAIDTSRFLSRLRYIAITLNSSLSEV